MLSQKIHFGKYTAKTIQEVYCGWKTPKTIELAKYMKLKIQEYSENSTRGNLPYSLSHQDIFFEISEISVKENLLHVVTNSNNLFFSKDYDHSEKLYLLAKNRKWEDDILIYVMDLKRNSKREWYVRDSEFEIGDGDPFYIKYCLEQNDLYLNNEDKKEIVGLDIFKFEGIKFTLENSKEHEEDSYEIYTQNYSMTPITSYIKMPENYFGI